MSKRTVRNTEIFNQIKQIDCEYITKMQIEANNLLSDNSLSFDNKNLVALFITMCVITKSTIEYSSYNDRIFKTTDIYHPELSIAKYIGFIKHDKMLEYYNEGLNKINCLKLLLEKPRKVVKIDNIENKEEYNHFISRILDKFLEGDISDDSFHAQCETLVEKYPQYNFQLP